MGIFIQDTEMILFFRSIAGFLLIVIIRENSNPENSMQIS